MKKIGALFCPFLLLMLMGLTSPSAYPVDIKTGIEGFSLSIHGDIDSLFSFYEGWNEPSKSPFRFPDRSYLGLTSEYKNVGIDASYYIYKPWEEGSLAEYSHFWHKIYFYWKFSDEFMFKVGMFDLNFALKFDSTWWMSILWCLGMEEPYDTGLGIEYHGKKTPIGLYLSYFRDKEGTYDQPATYDPAPGTGEKDIIVGRLIYPFQLAEGTKLELGIAGYHGRTQEYTINDVDWTEGDRTMFDADAVLSIGDNLTFSAEFIRFNFNTKASDGSKWMPMSGFGMPDYYSTPLEGSTYWLDGMYTKPLDFKFLQSVSVANNFSAIIPKDGENIYQNTVSLQFQSVSTYTWIEWIMYKDDNLPDAKWDWMLTTILRYSF